MGIFANTINNNLDDIIIKSEFINCISESLRDPSNTNKEELDKFIIFDNYKKFIGIDLNNIGNLKFKKTTVTLSSKMVNIIMCFEYTVYINMDIEKKYSPIFELMVEGGNKKKDFNIITNNIQLKLILNNTFKAKNLNIKIINNFSDSKYLDNFLISLFSRSKKIRNNVGEINIDAKDITYKDYFDKDKCPFYNICSGSDLVGKFPQINIDQNNNYDTYKIYLNFGYSAQKSTTYLIDNILRTNHEVLKKSLNDIMWNMFKPIPDNIDHFILKNYYKGVTITKPAE